MHRATLAGAFRVRFVAALAAMYLVVVLLVTLWPTAVDRGLDVYLDRILQELHQRGVPTFVNYAFVEFAANIVFFVPVGFLGALLVTRRLQWLAVPAGAVLSAALEAVQGAILPGRVSSPADVVANAVGALVGCATAIAVRLLIAHRDELVSRDVVAGRRASDGLPVRE